MPIIALVCYKYKQWLFIYQNVYPCFKELNKTNCCVNMLFIKNINSHFKIYKLHTQYVTYDTSVKL